MHILRVCKANGYSLKDLHYLFNTLIMSILTYSIRVWAVAFQSKYLDLIDKLQKRAFRYGYIDHVTPIRQIIEDRDLKMWTDMTSVPENVENVV